MGFFKAGKVDSNPYNKTYNGQNWVIQISLINIKNNVAATLFTQNINQMILYNDIQCMCPTFELTYFDLGQNLTKILDNNNLLLHIAMIQPPPNGQEYWKKADLLNLDLLFNVDKISTVFKKNNNTMYRFNTTHFNQKYLLKNINYSTIKDLKDTSNTKESPLAIINKLLFKVDYPTDQIVNDTTQRINFISSQTMSIKDCVDHLLRKAVSVEDPPTYFVHNLKSGKAMLINSKKLQDRLYNPTNFFNVYGAADSKYLNFDLLTQVSNLVNNSFNAGILSERYLSQFKFRHFDQNTRKWSTTTFNYNKINNLFNREVLNSNMYESVFTIKEKVDNNDMSYDFPNDNEQKMYLFLRELQLGTNSITFDVVGNITRDAGQYVNLTCANEAQIPRYEGLWHVYSCEHKWSGKIYTNQLVCYRTFNKKPIWTDTNQNRQQQV